MHTITQHETIDIKRNQLNRRRFLHTVSAAALASGTLSLRDIVSLEATELKKQNRSMIMLWMNGAPSQFETFDPKPNHENGGETKAIKTSVSGIEIAEGWEQTAKVMQHCSVIRSMNNKEGNHQRAVYQLHTGYVPSGSVKHPGLGSNIAHELKNPATELPSIVTIGGGRQIDVGGSFLGVEYDPFFVDTPGQLPRNVSLQTSKDRYTRRMQLLGKMEDNFAQKGGEVIVNNHQQIYSKTNEMVLSPDVQAFNLSAESPALVKKYGDSNFGKGCLLARRLVEEGVNYVEVVMDGWDTHLDNFDRVKKQADAVDPAMAALIADLSDRGMLDSTLVVWMGEFGRTPKINPRGGRDHYPRAFNALMAGGGIKGGQVIGATSKDGSEVTDQPVSVPDLFQSICHSLNVNANKEHMSPLGRPMKIVDGGSVVKNLFS